MKIPLFLKQLSYLAIILFFISCIKEDQIERLFPKVRNLEVTNISEKGATFSAEIVNDGGFEILEYGFIWSSGSANTAFSIDQSEKKIFTNPIKSGKFSANITSTLDIRRYSATNRCSVKAFLKTKDYSVYGNSVSFISLGSGAPTINQLLPNNGVWGDTIQIKGKDFSYIEKNNKVTFKDKVASVIKSNDSIITAIVPEGIDSKEVTVSVEIANKVATATDKFEIKSPIIASITPLTATFGDEITITGDNFGIKPEYNKVYFGDILTTIISSDKNTIKVIVPNDLESSITTIKVQSHAVDVTYNKNFNLKKPVITFVDDAIKTSTEIIIKADFFNPIKEKNKITFNGVQGEIISIENKNIKVKVPIGPFLNRKIKVKLQITDISFEYPKEITILDKWILVSKDLPFNYNGNNSYYLSANNNIFLVASPNNYIDFSYYLWKLNPIDFSWERFDIPNNILVNNFISDGLNLYFYDGSNNNFWEFNPTTNQWTQKQSFPGIKRDGASQFTINGEIYIGLGSNDTDILHDFYKYNSSSNTWIKISDYTYNTYFRRNYTSTFVINGVAYLGNGASNNGMSDFWSYNPITDEWKRIADFVDSRYNTSAFALNGKGYVTGGNVVGGNNSNACWQYDPTLNSWKKIENVGLNVRRSHFSFVLNGKAYVGGGISGSSNVYDMYEFKSD